MKIKHYRPTDGWSEFLYPIPFVEDYYISCSYSSFLDPIRIFKVIKNKSLVWV
jgi:hypothetical protein